MKKYLVLILLPLFIYGCCEADLWNDDTRAEETGSKNFSSSQIQKVKVDTRNGSVESSVWHDDSIHVSYEKWATGDDREEALDHLDDVKVTFSRNTASGTLYIDVHHPVRISTNYGCNVSLKLPASLFLDLETSNGAIVVSGSQDGLECSTSNGAIKLLDTRGNAKLSTSNGGIVVENHYGELTGKTSNGVVAVDIVLPEHGECVLKTSNGAINLSVPNTASAMVEASTSNGRVDVDDLDVTVIKMEKTSFKGKIGNGQGNIDLETSNGGILIKGL
jgi:DUF4097 and DUF4098 domain-containing protein YvlB